MNGFVKEFIVCGTLTTIMLLIKPIPMLVKFIPVIFLFSVYFGYAIFIFIKEIVRQIRSN